MSAKRSEFTRMMKRSDEMSQRYQERITRQTKVIDSLLAANAIQGDALFKIVEEAKNVKEARKVANDARKKVKAILAVPVDERNAS